MKTARYTPDEVIRAIRETRGTLYLAARNLGCHPNTIRNYLRRYAAVRDAMETERGEAVDAAELALRQAVLQGKPWAIQFTLRTLGRDRGYIERHETIVEQAEAEIVTRLVVRQEEPDPERC